MTGEGEVAGPARSVYQLRVVHPSTGARVVDGAIDVVANLFLHDDRQYIKDVTLEIVDLRSHKIVMKVHETQEGARGLAELIAVDLDRLDPSAFAAEWGIGTSA
jgi:hypothetical protein